MPPPNHHFPWVIKYRIFMWIVGMCGLERVNHNADARRHETTVAVQLMSVSRGLRELNAFDGRKIHSTLLNGMGGDISFPHACSASTSALPVVPWILVEGLVGALHKKLADRVL